MLDLTPSSPLFLVWSFPPFFFFFFLLQRQTPLALLLSNHHDSWGSSLEPRTSLYLGLVVEPKSVLRHPSPYCSMYMLLLSAVLLAVLLQPVAASSPIMELTPPGTPLELPFLNMDELFLCQLCGMQYELCWCIVRLHPALRNFVLTATTADATLRRNNAHRRPRSRRHPAA